MVGCFPAGLVDFVEDVHGDAQASPSLRSFDQVLDQRHAVEDDAFAGPRHVREDAMFDRIVLGAIGRIMRDAQFETCAIGQRLQVLSKQG